jgi:hypothetical protein
MSDINLTENMSKLLKELSGGILDLNNGSSIREAPNGGVRIICSTGYKWDFTNGAVYKRVQGESEDIIITYLQANPPSMTDDFGDNFIVGSLWVTSEGVTWQADSVDEDNAVWAQRVTAAQANAAATTALNTANDALNATSQWKESDYLRPFNDNFTLMTTGGRAFTFDSGNVMVESQYIGNSDGIIDIPDGITHLYDNQQVYSQMAWTSLGSPSGAASLPASLYVIVLTDSNYASGGTFSEDKIVTLFTWMATQPAFFVPRPAVTRFLDASYSSYSLSNSVYDSTFLATYDALVAAGWNIYLPNNNMPYVIPNGGPWSDMAVSGYSNGTHQIAEGHPSYTHCTNPSMLYLLWSSDNVATDAPLESVSLDNVPNFPHNILLNFPITGPNATLTLAGGLYGFLS